MANLPHLTPPLPRVMVDVNVLITGFLWPRWQHVILQHALNGDLRLVLPPLVIDSAHEHIRALDPDQVGRFEQFLADCDVELVDDPSREQVRQHLDLVRDETDVPVALAAINAQVDYFITYDRDFTDAGPTTAKVRQALPGIMLPPVFLREVMGWTSEQLEAIRHRTWSDLEEAE